MKDCVKLLNEFTVVYEPVTNPKSDICVDELIAPLNDVKNEPVSLSVIQLPLTLSIVFNLSTNDDVDCDAVNVFKFEIDVTKLAVETEAVNVFNCSIEDVTEPVTKYLKSNELVNCDEPLIVPAGVAEILPLATYLVSNEEVNCEEPDIVPVGMVVDELINPNAVICADELNKFTGNG